MIEDLISKASAKLSKNYSSGTSVVLSSRIRLARNLNDFLFPNRAVKSHKCDILSNIQSVLCTIPFMNKGYFFKMDNLTKLEKKMLVERHFISRELSDMDEGSAVNISSDHTCSVMINEEDHLRIQFIKNGFNFNSLWKTVNDFDDLLEDKLSYAFSKDIGFLTACPSNLGTGLRASVMLHLPGLLISGNIDKIIRASNQLGLAVRGLLVKDLTL